MELKRVCAFYFSPTGTTETITLTVAKRLARDLSLPLSLRDFTPPESRLESPRFESGDLVVFGVPTYAGRVPNVLLKYLSGLKGEGSLAVPLVLYGNRSYDDSLMESKKLLEAGGLKAVAAGAFIGEHSFSKVLAANRPDTADLALAEQFAKRVSEKIKALPSPKAISSLTVKGEEPLRPYYQPRDRAGTPISILKVKPKTGAACTGCGLCADLCPMGSVSRENPAEIHGVCIKCGACVKRCPVGAKFYDDEGYLYHKTELELCYERRAQPELFL